MLLFNKLVCSQHDFFCLIRTASTTRLKLAKDQAQFSKWAHQSSHLSIRITCTQIQGWDEARKLMIQNEEEWSRTLTQLPLNIENDLSTVLKKKLKDDTWEAKMQMQMFSHFKISASSWSILTFSLSLKNPIFSLLKMTSKLKFRWKLKFI